MDHDKEHFEDKLDKMLKNALQEKPEELDYFKDLTIVPMDKMMKRAMKSIRRRRIGKFVTLKRALAIACAIIVLSTVFSIAMDTGKVQAFRFQTLKIVTVIKGAIINLNIISNEDSGNEKTNEKIEIEDSKIVKTFTLSHARESVGHHIPSPAYLPEGYTEEHVIWTRFKYGNETVELVYTDEKNNVLKFLQTKSVETGKQGIASSDKNSKVINVMDTEATVIFTNDVGRSSL